jgi:uroporphyrinogen decarboxylase
MLRADYEPIIASEGRAVACKGMVAGLMEAGNWMRGMEAFFMDLLDDPPVARAILDEVLQVKHGYWDEVLSRAGDVIDVVYEADDYGAQKSLLISPVAWRREIKPRLRILCEHIHARSKARIFLHSDGPIREIIPDLIEVGIDILNPVQFST